MNFLQYILALSDMFLLRIKKMNLVPNFDISEKKVYSFNILEV